MNKIFILKIPLLICGIYLVFSHPMQAQDQRILTLEDAVAMGIAHNKQLKTDSISLLQADTKAVQSKNPLLPQVSVNLSYIRLSDNITPFKVAFPTGEAVLNPQILNQSYNSLQVKQLVWAGNKIKYVSDLLALDKKVIYFDMGKNKSDIDYNITTLWYNLFTVGQSKKLLETNIELLSNQKKDADNFVKQGILLGNEILKIELAITALQSSLSDLEKTQALLNYNICTLTGLDTKTVIKVPDTLPKMAQEQGNLDQYLEKAIKNRFELKGLSIRKEQADIGLKLTKTNPLPVISAGASVNVDLPNQRLFPNEAKFTPTWNIGVFFNWNLTDIYTNNEKIKENNLAISKLNIAQSQIQEGIKMEVNADYINYLQAQQKIILANKAVEQATENFRIEQNKFKTQTTTATEFLNANTLLIQTQINLTTAIANVELAYKKLLKSIN
jgi:outer membrane protein